MPDGLHWAIKASLIGYVSALDDGVVEVVAPAERHDDGFWFPLHSATAAGLRFGGTVRLRGHWGMLDLEFRDPLLAVEGETGMLAVRERGREGDVAFATLSLQAPEIWSAALTGRGAQLVGGQYPPGTTLDPVRIERSGDA